MRYLPPDPDLQISFYYRLKAIRDVYLSDALRMAVAEIPIAAIDSELSRLVPEDALRRVASFGIRGEVVFPVPSILTHSPRLLGYYRLLYGVSQKEFYSKGPFGPFKRMETSLKPPHRILLDVEDLCISLIKTASDLIFQIDHLSKDIVHDLQLLTLGPQFRGARNTELGKAATQRTFALIKDLVASYITNATDSVIVITNDSDREVRIEFSSDPDIIIVESVRKTKTPIISVEIKGGTDYSNVHNRLGEAEKSHQKAKSKGFFEFWTILAIDVDMNVARSESPTTSHFFHLDRLYDKTSSEREQFVDILSSKLSIRID
ncbi:MAG: XcyI family restriction endonuclease [Alkalispirochaeta sp.]